LPSTRATVAPNRFVRRFGPAERSAKWLRTKRASRAAKRRIPTYNALLPSAAGEFARPLAVGCQRAKERSSEKSEVEVNPKIASA
jgi:hypothetical protein